MQSIISEVPDYTNTLSPVQELSSFPFSQVERIILNYIECHGVDGWAELKRLIERSQPECIGHTGSMDCADPKSRDEANGVWR